MPRGLVAFELQADQTPLRAAAKAIRGHRFEGSNDGHAVFSFPAAPDVVALVINSFDPVISPSSGDAIRALLAQELLLFENSGADHLEDFVDPQLSMARLSLHTTFADGDAYVPFVARLEAGLREILGDGPGITVTGIGVLMGRTFRLLDITMAQSYAIALLVITPLMVLLIGDLRRGLLSMIPNLLPIWLTLGLMGLLGIPLDSSTLLLGCVLIGLAVDDTIHFMHKFQHYMVLHGDARRAVRETLETTGAALFFTTLVITAGFSTMFFGYMNNTREFGMLAGFAATTAFLADLLVAPALMALATRQRAPLEVPAEATAAGEGA